MVSVMHDITAGVVEHIYIISRLDTDKSIKYIELILTISVLKKYSA